jgi:hypothetical protein
METFPILLMKLDLLPPSLARAGSTGDQYAISRQYKIEIQTQVRLYTQFFACVTISVRHYSGYPTSLFGLAALGTP